MRASECAEHYTETRVDGRFDRYQEADVSAYGKSGSGPYDHFFTEF
jgi:hypothetical protein